MNKGTLYAIGAYGLWGLLPLYWRALHDVPALEILAHRVVWALLITLGLVVLRREGRGLLGAFAKPRVVGVFAVSALLLSVNWFVYIWAVNAGHVVETSLGYFINPLVNVALGVLFLHERLRPGQAVAVVIALIGVLYLTFLYGSPPWIALALAGSFGAYGLIRKTASLESLAGLTLETLLIAPLALGYLLFLEYGGQSAFLHASVPTSALLIGAGLVTAVPLLLFGAGARKITLTTLGLLQYIAPTIQFMLGITVFGEPLSPQRLIGFSLVWLALAIYTVEGISAGGRTAQPRPSRV